MKIKLKRFNNFINEIDENLDNIKSSERGLDRFGMTNYDDLPSDLRKIAKDLGYENVDLAGREGISSKSINEIELFSEDEGYDYSSAALWISANDDNKFTKDSPIIFSIDIVGKHDFNFEIHRNRYNYEDIKKMLYPVSELKRDLEILISGFRKDDESRNRNLIKQFITDKGVKLKSKDHIGYYGGL